MPKKKSTKRASTSKSAKTKDALPETDEGLQDSTGDIAVSEPVSDNESHPLPIWLMVFVGMIILWGDVYLINHGGSFETKVYKPYRTLDEVSNIGPKSPEEIFAAKGKVAYNKFCASCHQGNGLGVAGQFPPVAGSDWVNTEGPNRLIRIVLNGLIGPITVNGVEYNSNMLAWKDSLSDEDIAAILTFIRTNETWGNSASPVTPEQVAAIRQVTGSRGSTDYWKAEELLGIPHSD